MQQLSGHDASFVYFDLPHAPMHGCFLGLYDPSKAPAGRVDLEKIQGHIAERLHLARCFRQRLVRVPFDWDHPYWVEDKNFDLEYHVRHIALPPPGDWAQLCRQCERIQARSLDLSRPLWELYLIEGLNQLEGVPSGSFAMLIKFHHAAIDGASGAEIIQAIHDSDPGAEAGPVEDPWEPEEEPSAAELLWRAHSNAWLRSWEYAGLVARTVPRLAPFNRRLLRQEFSVPGAPPATRFGGRVTAHRSFDAVRLELEEVRELKRSVDGATVNDVLITVCGGALREYLQEKRELPEESLLAMLPISVRDEGDEEGAGNRVSAMVVPIHTDVEDAGERLAAVRESTRNSKEMTNAIGARLLADHTQFMPGALIGQAMRLTAAMPTEAPGAANYNTVISNVPGPRARLYAAGARLVSTYGIGIPHDGMGLMHGIWSYCGELTIGATACREMLPDPEFYAACLGRSYRSLKHATLGGRA
ncbi:MAG: wax ester/triacylglycerol synthase family O-acyltransferase [Myxococcales bacterium]|nr:wax ester/triacylglycerol synthase family O-acyltransferase [Myxococcales bacterium]